MSALLPHLDGATRYLSRAETVSQDELRIIERFLTALHRKGLLHEGALAGDDRDDETLA